jgi:hypothetical protein
VAGQIDTDQKLSSQHRENSWPFTQHDLIEVRLVPVKIDALLGEEINVVVPPQFAS